MSRQTKDLGGGGNMADDAARFRKHVERWKAEDPPYDREAWSELREGLDRSRSEHREHFSEDGPKAERRPTCPKR